MRALSRARATAPKARTHPCVYVCVIERVDGKWPDLFVGGLRKCR